MKQKKFMTFSCIVFSAVIFLTSCGENKPQSDLSAVDSVSNMPESTVSKPSSEFENITVKQKNMRMNSLHSHMRAKAIHCRFQEITLKTI